jgi:PHD/YefM family antitoxin component YafN of YafNO toxin-antitoxin module
LLAKSQTIKIGREPLVLVPLSLWRKVEDVLEDQEALASKRYLRRIRQARKDIAAGKAVHPFR